MRIAIIGAGLAGACLANRLRHRHRVEVFEKSRGSGGRMSTRRVEDWKADHGAQFFTIRDEGFAQLAEPMIREGFIRPWKPRLAVFRKGDWVLDDWKDPHFVAAPCMNSATAKLLEGVEVHYQTRISEISGHSGHWELRSTHQYYGFFDLVISTLPAPQAVEIIPSECDFVEDLRLVQMDPCLAFFARLKEDIDLGWDAAIVRDHPVTWMAMNHSKPGRQQLIPVFVMHLQADFSAQDFEQDMQSWCIETTATLAKVHPSQIEAFQIHRWKYSRTSKPASKPSFYDSQMGLAAAGDWGPGERVEGAAISALDLLKQID